MPILEETKFLTFISFLGFSFVIPLLLALVLTKGSIISAFKLNILAIPTERSSHTKPTPRIGGIGFSITFFIVLVLLIPSLKDEPKILKFLQVLTIGGFVAFLLGLIDDVRGLSPIVKLGGQIVVSIIPLLFGIYLHHIYIPFIGTTELGVLGIVISFCWILFFLNAFNFMDGMDGKAGTFTIYAVLGLLLYLAIKTPPVGGSDLLFYSIIVCLSLLAAVAGFLVFNYPPAKTFMGDCGSQFLGFVLAFFAVYFAKIFEGFMILLLPFTYDAIYTLFRRWRRGENLLKAHRSHLYQRLMIIGYSHKQVLKICQGTYLVCAGCFLVFSLSKSPLVKTCAFAVSLITMILYTLFVIHKEKTTKNA